MLTPKQIKILSAFLRKPYKELTYKEIKHISKDRSNSIIQKAIGTFLQQNLIKKRGVGNIFLYQLNLKNSVVFSYFDILIQEKMSIAAKKTILKIKEELSDLEFISIVIFGSYAEGTQTEKSDLDIAVFVNTIEDKKRGELALKAAAFKTILNIDFYVFTKKEMLEMLRDKFENVGKQLAYKHLVIHNPIIFYGILEEGIDNGFKIVYSESGK